MASWNHKLNISHIFHNDNLSLEEKTKDIILTIKSRPWYNEDLYYFQELEDTLEEMSDAGEANDVEWFDQCWATAYDIFDAERVWVVTQ
jgi:hypothetical protein